jgi:uncharacterized membrane protein YagU involved in acid resistance
MTTRNAIATAILFGGLVAGTLDLGAASLMSGKDPGFICQFIASGLIGKQAAFAGGAGTVVIGLLLQWAMSVTIAAIFVLASLRLPILRRLWLAAGLAYGVGVFFVMEWVVVPLSAVGRAPHFTPESFAQNMAAMMVFGLIIAGCARWRMGGAGRAI